jgi:endonuclease/exonuclease/phosphatase (EEP) superfamily protein YafD
VRFNAPPRSTLRRVFTLAGSVRITGRGPRPIGWRE